MHPYLYTPTPNVHSRTRHQRPQPAPAIHHLLSLHTYDLQPPTSYIKIQTTRHPVQEPVERVRVMAGHICTHSIPFRQTDTASNPTRRTEAPARPPLQLPYNPPPSNSHLLRELPYKSQKSECKKEANLYIIHLRLQLVNTSLRTHVSTYMPYETIPCVQACAELVHDPALSTSLRMQARAPARTSTPRAAAPVQPLRTRPNDPLPRQPTASVQQIPSYTTYAPVVKSVHRHAQRSSNRPLTYP